MTPPSNDNSNDPGEMMSPRLHRLIDLLAKMAVDQDFNEHMAQCGSKADAGSKVE